MGRRILATELRQATKASVSLRDSLLKFVQAFGVQTAHTATSNAQSKLDVRLARWLLMAHDRTGDDTLTLTHEFLSLMLGVRRPSRRIGGKANSAYHEPMNAAPEIVETSDIDIWRRLALSPLVQD